MMAIRYIVRRHSPWMPGQGPRATYSESVFTTRVDARRYIDAMRVKGITDYMHIVEEER